MESNDGKATRIYGRVLPRTDPRLVLGGAIVLAGIVTLTMRPNQSKMMKGEKIPTVPYGGVAKDPHRFPEGPREVSSITRQENRGPIEAHADAMKPRAEPGGVATRERS